MRFSNDNSNWDSWETYATSKTGWYLIPGTGNKTVYVQYKDSAGNSSETYTDTIYYQEETASIGPTGPSAPSATTAPAPTTPPPTLIPDADIYSDEYKAILEKESEFTKQ